MIGWGSEYEESDQARPEMSNAFTSAATPLEAHVCQVSERVLGITPVGVHDDFLELGGHSLMATQLISRLRQLFRVDLPLTALFAAPTPGRMANMVLARIIDDVDALMENEAQRLLQQPELIGRNE